MPQFSNALEVLRLLPKTNCRDCGEKTCMAFAGQVYLGKKQLIQCPHLSPEVAAGYTSQQRKANVQEEDFLRNIEVMKTTLRTLDLAKRAESIGASYDGTFLTLPLIPRTSKGKKTAVSNAVQKL